MSAATHAARATRRFKAESGVQLIGIIHVRAASRGERSHFSADTTTNFYQF
jgi:hypothetical protein